MRYLKKAEEKLKRYTEVESLLHDPVVSSDPAKARDLGKEFRSLQKVVHHFTEYKKVTAEIEESRKMVADKTQPELAEMAAQELPDLEAREAKVSKELESLLARVDPMLAKNAIIEIRAGTGGLEAGLFVGDLFKMYQKYAQEFGFKLEILSSAANEAGGFKEIICQINGDGAYGRFKWESGTHRVQRVPATETQGRIHTSAVTVALMPEAEEIDLEIKNEDLKYDVFRSGGPGGQSVNTTDSAVRITHIPSGLVVSCQDEKSQLKNKIKGLKILRARLFDKITSERNAELAKQRKEQVGSGDRSEKIRTYNYPDGRVTDHRIGMTKYNLEAVLAGDIGDFVDALYEAELAKENA